MDQAIPVCIIPAAGRAQRMGEWKPLLDWHGRTVIEAVIQTAVRAGLHPLVVGGFRAGELRDRLSAYSQLSFAENPEWATGMLGSVRCGLEAVRVMADGPGTRFRADGAFVCPADMPLIRPELYARMLGSIPEALRFDALGIFPRFGGQLGHPVWINLAVLPRLRDAPPDARLRQYLLENPPLYLDCQDDSIVMDLDTPEEYAAALRRPYDKAVSPSASQSL